MPDLESQLRADTQTTGVIPVIDYVTPTPRRRTRILPIVSAAFSGFLAFIYCFVVCFYAAVSLTLRYDGPGVLTGILCIVGLAISGWIGWLFFRTILNESNSIAPPGGNS